ncbi:alpha/beta hydrolase [Nioella sediminis]|uniref:alpha/beta hydrolase n=1 Tax=Nioella sediminis TaxID=1912092 RepID=UPI0008FD8FD0|nr:alpha/beta fold hydrolase [Nioella sediminis]
MTRFLLAALLFLTAACGTPPNIAMVTRTVPDAGVRTVFVATNRAFEDQNFTAGRESGVEYARFDVSIPPNRDLGEVTWPRGQVPDPTTDFVVTDAGSYPSPTAFRADIRTALNALPPEDQEVVVFVHGYNNNFASGLFRIAQMAHDYDAPGLTAHFAWPSAGNPFGYVFDRESAAFSRDALEQFLRDLHAAGARRILLVGHSLGGHITMETLRQIRISGDDAVLQSLSGIVLISPDIDIEVFQSQARAVDPLPQPFVVFTSANDRALRLSAGITGRQNRLGNLGTAEDVAEFNILLVDISAFRSGVGDWTNHSTLVTSPSLIQMFQGLPDIGTGSGDIPIDLVSGTVLTVRNATQILLSPVGQ